MARVALKPSKAVAALLREKREQLGLSLRQIEKKTREAGEIIPFPTLAKVEQGRVDPGVRRLQLLLQIYRVPFELVSDLIELENHAGKLPRTKDPKKLYDSAVELWKAGDTRQSMACLIALQKLLQERPEEAAFRQKATITFAIMAGGLGKYHLSLDLIGKLLVQTLDRELLISALVQAGVCWHWIGSGEAALAFLERAEKHLRPDDHRELAWARHQKAVTLLGMGRYEHARESLEEALAAYRKAKDLYGECRALVVQGRIHTKKGDHRAALAAMRHARLHAEKNGFTRLKILRSIDEAQALLLLGEVEPAVPILRAALADALREQDHKAEFYAHHGLWKASLAMGLEEQAAYELSAARHYLAYVEDRSEETDEIRALEPEQGRARKPGRGKKSV